MTEEMTVKDIKRRLDEHKHWIQRLVSMHKDEFDRIEGIKVKGKGRKK